MTVFYVSLLKQCKSDGKVHPPPPPLEIDGDLYYDVDQILIIGIVKLDEELSGNTWLSGLVTLMKVTHGNLSQILRHAHSLLTYLLYLLIDQYLHANQLRKEFVSKSRGLAPLITRRKRREILLSRTLRKLRNQQPLIKCARNRGSLRPGPSLPVQWILIINPEEANACGTRL